MDRRHEGALAVSAVAVSVLPVAHETMMAGPRHAMIEADHRATIELGRFAKGQGASIGKLGKGYKMNLAVATATADQMVVVAMALARDRVVVLDLGRAAIFAADLLGQVDEGPVVDHGLEWMGETATRWGRDGGPRFARDGRGAEWSSFCARWPWTGRTAVGARSRPRRTAMGQRLAARPAMGTEPRTQRTTMGRDHRHGKGGSQWAHQSTSRWPRLGA